MSKKILIVEDNIDLCEMYKIAFTSKKFEVSISTNGMSAVSLVDTFKPDIILLDIMMPFVSGYDFLQTIRDRGNHVLIIINSNLSQERDIEKSFELGADAYFKKADYTPYEMVDKVEDLMKANN